MIFRLPKTCLTRAKGEEFRTELKKLILQHGSIEVSFENVECMNPSFADDCFGKLMKDLGYSAFMAKVKLKGKGINLTIRTLVNAVLADRKV